MTGIGVRTDQAPPLSVPLRFFLTAPIFGMAAAALLLAVPQGLEARWQPTLLAATHLLTLGYLTMAMLGALMQMLPVLAGSPVRRPRVIAGFVHVFLVVGTVGLSANFLMPGPLLVHLALTALGAAFAIFLLAAAVSLARADANPSVLTMRLAVVGLAVAVALGMLLVSGRAPALLGAMPTPADLHIGWALLGWIAILVIGVGYQVVPMFQLTPAYPAVLRTWLTPLAALALVVWSVAELAGERAPLWLRSLALASLAALLVAFAVVTLWLQRQRRRRLPDTTVRFWILSMASLIGAVLLATAYLSGAVIEPRLMTLAVAWMLVGFATSVIVGMLYKIVPFLVWLHLQARAGGSVPNMKDIIPDARSLPHVWVHAAAVALLAPAVFIPSLLAPAGAALFASFAWLGVNLLAAARQYYRRSRPPLAAAHAD